MKRVAPILISVVVAGSISAVEEVVPESTPTALSAPDLVDVQKLDVGIKLDIRYSTPFNPFQKKIYQEARCFLRKPVADALVRAQAAFRLQGVSLKVYDCYRPLSVQQQMWKGTPLASYTDSPRERNHSRGGAVDVTLIGHWDEELPMPSQYGEFKKKKTSQKLLKKARRNAKRLEALMKAEGFSPDRDLWWHFDFHDVSSYPTEDMPLGRLKSRGETKQSP